MSDPRLDLGTGPSSEALSWWANHSHRFVLPVAGAVSVALGVSATVDSHLPWGAYVPPLLLLVGGGTLASGLAALLVRRSYAHRISAQQPTVIRPPAAASLCPSCSAQNLGTTTSRTLAWNRTRVPTGRGASGEPAMTIPTDPGDFLWGSWAAGGGRLPGELVGPVPETAWAPPVPDAPVLYEEGEPDLMGPPRPTMPLEMVPSPVVEVDTRIAPRPPVVTTKLLTPGSDAREALPGWTDSRLVGGASSLTRSSVVNPVHHEALNPTPPHLRPRPSVASLAHHPRAKQIERGVRCASCRTPVLDPPKWRRCLDCQRTLCADCVVSALLTYQRGWCSRCAEERDLTVLSSIVTARAPRRARSVLYSEGDPFRGGLSGVPERSPLARLRGAPAAGPAA